MRRNKFALSLVRQGNRYGLERHERLVRGQLGCGTVRVRERMLTGWEGKLASPFLGNLIKRLGKERKFRICAHDAIIMENGGER